VQNARSTPWIDGTVNDAFRVRHIERIGNLHCVSRISAPLRDGALSLIHDHASTCLKTIAGLGFPARSLIGNGTSNSTSS
jgi:hypothetical protein